MKTAATQQRAPSPARLRAGLVKGLIGRGVLTSPHWREAFCAVPRHQFVRRCAVPTEEGLEWHDLGDPGQYSTALVAIHQNTPLITQVDDRGTVTSASSEPSLMAMMLEAGDFRPGMNVLEIGTGTGYNAALLSHAMGDCAVTSVELDPHLAEAAATALRQVGYEPTVVCGDGTQGHTQRAPYDRIIATCSVPRIPDAWREQLKPGGVVVVNVGHGLARLALTPQGNLEGAFFGYASFMPMRASLGEVAVTTQEVLALAGHTIPRSGRPMLPLQNRMVTFLMSVIMPDVSHVIEVHQDGNDHILVHSESGSWARAFDAGLTLASVSESGPRKLWTELEEIVGRWEEAGRPSVSNCGLTVTSQGVHILWSGSPTHYRWILT